MHASVSALFLHSRGQAKKWGVTVWLALVFSAVLFSGEPARIINIKVVADQEFKTWGAWTFDFTNLVRECSLCFSRRFGLSFRVKEYVYWKPEDKKTNFPGLLSELMQDVPCADCDIVIGIMSPSKIRSAHSGISSYTPAYAVLEWVEPRDSRKFLLLHEVCHILGALDLEKEDSVMSRRQPGFRFDDFTTRAILLNRERLFGPAVFPLPNNRLDEAIALYRNAAEQSPNEALVHRFLSRLFQEKENWLEMLTEMEKALVLEPNFVHLENLLEDLYSWGEDATKPVRECRKILESRPGFPEIQFNLGLALSRRGKIDEAVSMFQRTVESQPRHFQARTQLGSICLGQGRIDEAIWEFRQAAEISPERAESHLNLATALMFKIQNSPGARPEGALLQEVMTHCRRAISINPRFAEEHNILGLALFYSNLQAEARDEFQRTLELEPGHVIACFNLGAICLKNNSLGNAVFYFERALQLQPGFVPAYRALAYIYSSLGETDKSQTCLSRAEELEMTASGKFIGLLRDPLVEKSRADGPK